MQAIPMMDKLRGMREARAKDSTKFNSRLGLLAHYAYTLDELPDVLSYVSYYQSKIQYTGFLGGRPDAEVREVNAEVRRILGVPRSEKTMGSDGELVWITETDDIKVVVYGGTIPDNCRLVSKTNTYTTYEMVCNEEV